MSDIYQIANIGLIEGTQRLEAISRNAAGASLTGYRRHVVVDRPFTASLAAQIEGANAPAPDVAKATPPAALEHVNLQPGSITMTGRALDVAIEDDDKFFALSDGVQTWLTRAGSFRVDEAGVLVGDGGLPVLTQQGEARLPGSDVQITSDGRIMHEGVVVATVQLFEPNEPTSLRAATGALLVAPEGIHPADTVRVRSGALETSNTDAGREMLGLMMLSRQFESLTRIVQSYDEVLGQTIEKLAEI
jgi:flagellar basal-body rod protein FlgF